jgi:hypothetical protein
MIYIRVKRDAELTRELPVKNPGVRALDGRRLEDARTVEQIRHF